MEGVLQNSNNSQKTLQRDSHARHVTTHTNLNSDLKRYLFYKFNLKRHFPLHIFLKTAYRPLLLPPPPTPQQASQISHSRYKFIISIFRLGFVSPEIESLIGKLLLCLLGNFVLIFNFFAVCIDSWRQNLVDCAVDLKKRKMQLVWSFNWNTQFFKRLYFCRRLNLEFSVFLC